MIPHGFIQDLLSRVDIADVVGRHVQLKKGGANLSGLCPFHAEKSPSFTVSPTKQFYHCFGCGANGDAIRFLVEYSGMSFVDAVTELAQQVGLRVPQDEASPAERERAAAHKQKQASLTDILAKASEHYRAQLKASERAIDYLKRRGLSGAVAAQFGLGYAPDGWRSLASAFAQYDDPLLEEGGLVIAKPSDDGDESQTKRYDRFRDRIMFPIRSVQGDVIGFGARVLDRGEPKYLNSPETPVFSKGRELYGLHEARVALRQRGYALVVEGYMDVVALAQSGFGNAVATLGTAFTPDHAQKLFRFTDSVVFSFDGDTAGRRAAARALEASLPHASDTRTIRFLFLPVEHDPDSYVREFGASAFEDCVAQAVPLSRQLVVQASDGCDLATAEGRARLVAQARPLLEQLPAGVLKGQIADAVADAAQVARASLQPQPASSGRATAPPRMPMPRARPGRRPPSSNLDTAVRLLMQRCDLWEQLDHEAHELLTRQGPPHGDFFAWLDRLVHDQGSLSATALLEEIGRSDSGSALRELAGRVRENLGVAAGDEAGHELEVIVDRLRLQETQEALELIARSGELTPDSRERLQSLHELQARLKAKLARPATTAP